MILKRQKWTITGNGKLRLCAGFRPLSLNLKHSKATYATSVSKQQKTKNLTSKVHVYKELRSTFRTILDTLGHFGGGEVQLILHIKSLRLTIL